MVYLITFGCYGTHLPGDAKGSFDHVRRGERRFVAPNPALANYGRSLMTQDRYELSSARARQVVRHAIIEVCRHRAWSLLALHVRVTHVHALVDADTQPSRLLSDWKSYGTRALRAEALESPDRRIWAHSGHWREIRSSSAVAAAMRYVVEGQGEPMEWYRSEARA